MLLALGIVIVLVAGVFFITRRGSYPNDASRSNVGLRPDHVLHLPNGSTMKTVVVSDEERREWGLSRFPSLPADEGMLFLFDSDAPSFWMKDMSFPLDMV